MRLANALSVNDILLSRKLQEYPQVGIDYQRRPQPTCPRRYMKCLDSPGISWRHHSHKMHSLKTSLLSLLGFLAWSSAIPLSSRNPNHLLSTRQASERNGVIPDYQSPVCKYKGGALNNAIHGVYRLAHAARESHLSRIKANVLVV